MTDIYPIPDFLRRPVEAPRERPILFSAPMIRALLAGAKTQTRRTVKDTGFYAIEDHHGTDTAKRERAALATRCPYGQPGDRLWVRETFQVQSFNRYGGSLYPSITGAERRVSYRADGDRLDGYLGNGYLPWKPSIHMPRWASRILLEITAVRVERLNEIGREDAAAEGICYLAESGYDGKLPSGINVIQHHEWPEQNYSRLWEQINGAGSWAANPWVWAISFRRIAR